MADKRKRDYVSVYFKDPDVLVELKTFVEKDLRHGTVSSTICNLVKVVLPRIREAAASPHRSTPRFKIRLEDL